MRKSIFLLLFVLANAAYASANTVTLRFINVGPGYNDSSYYVYPYNFSINSSSSLVSLICDDFMDDIFLGESWRADVFSIGDVLAGNGQMHLSNNSLAAQNGQTRSEAYMEAAYLYKKLVSEPLTPSSAVNINHTIWALFSNTPFSSDANVLSLFSEATTNTAGLSVTDAQARFGDVVFYTPIDGTQSPTQYLSFRPQEMIGTQVPEPATMVLLALGLIALSSIVRSNRHELERRRAA